MKTIGLSNIPASCVSDYLHYQVSFFWEEKNRWERGVFTGMRWSSVYAEVVPWVLPQGKEQSIPIPDCAGVIVLIPTKKKKEGGSEDTWDPFSILKNPGEDLISGS